MCVAAFSVGFERQHALPAPDRLARLVPLALHPGKLLPESQFLRRHRNGHLQPRQRLVELALAPQRDAKLKVRYRSPCVKPQRLEIRGPRVDVPALCLQRVAQAVIEEGQTRIAERLGGVLRLRHRVPRGNGQVGVEPDGLLLRRGGFGIAAESAERVGEVAVQDRHFRLQADRLPQRFQGRFGLTFLHQRQAEVRVHPEDTRIERNGLAKLSDRLVCAVQLPEDHAEVIVEHDRIGPKVQSTPERFDRLVAPAHLLKGQAQGIQGVGIVRA